MTEADIGALFVYIKEARVIHLILAELEYPQPQIPIHIDNITSIGIDNSTIKQQRLRSMEIRCFWLLEHASQKYFNIYYHSGTELMVDYPNKAHTGPVYTHLRPYYIHMENSTIELIRAAPPSTWRGFVELLEDPYTKGIPLPKISNHYVPGRDS